MLTGVAEIERLLRAREFTGGEILLDRAFEESSCMSSLEDCSWLYKMENSWLQE
jgi:hypothetical protein